MPHASHAATVLAAVEELPACNLAHAMRRTGLGRRAFQNALEQLLAEGRVHRITAGRDALLLPDQPEIEEFREHVRVLRDPHLRRLHDHLNHADICSHAEIVEEARAWDWDAEATRWRLRRLERAELIQAVVDLQDQRRILYRQLPAHPMAIETLQRLDMYESQRTMAPR